MRHLQRSPGMQGDLKPEDFSIRELAEALTLDGHGCACEQMDPRQGRRRVCLEAEASEAVDVTAFLEHHRPGGAGENSCRHTPRRAFVAFAACRVQSRPDSTASGSPGIGRISRRRQLRCSLVMPYPQLGFRRGLYRDSLDDEARADRGGYPRGDLLRSHEPLC